MIVLNLNLTADSACLSPLGLNCPRLGSLWTSDSGWSRGSSLLAGGSWPVEFAQLPVLSFPSPLLVPCLPDDLIQLTAMCWMREFIQLAGRVMLPYSSGILTAVLPCLSYDDRKKSILVTPSCSHSCYSNPQGSACFLPLGRRASCTAGEGQEKSSHQLLKPALVLWL